MNNDPYEFKKWLEKIEEESKNNIFYKKNNNTTNINYNTPSYMPYKSTVLL